MALAVTFGSRHCCANFPLCSELQKQVRSSSGSRTRTPYCATCLVRSRCSFPECENYAAPSSGRYRTDFCTLHYRDPCNAAHRVWKLCSNSRIGCSHLAQASRSGKCFACCDWNLPCVHSLLGCGVHVRNSPNTPLAARSVCSRHGSSRCPFDPSNSVSCTSPSCGLPRTSSVEDRCTECLVGRLPCSRNCGRRTLVASNTLCLPCARENGRKTITPSAEPCSNSGASTCFALSDQDPGTDSALAPIPLMIYATEHPQKGLSPAYSCFNFPICRKSQKKVQLPRCQGSRVFLGRLPFCYSCNLVEEDYPPCAHPSCTHPLAPLGHGNSVVIAKDLLCNTFPHLPLLQILSKGCWSGIWCRSCAQRQFVDAFF